MKLCFSCFMVGCCWMGQCSSLGAFAARVETNEPPRYPWGFTIRSLKCAPVHHTPQFRALHLAGHTQPSGIIVILLWPLDFVDRGVLLMRSCITCCLLCPHFLQCNRLSVSATVLLCRTATDFSCTGREREERESERERERQTEGERGRENDKHPWCYGDF